MTGKQLAALRRKAGLSQAGFAAIIPLKVRTLQNWEQGRRAIGSVSEKWLRHVLACYQDRLLREGRLPKPFI